MKSSSKELPSKTIALAVTGAFVLSIGSASINAAENPFAIKLLSNGYQVADHHEGKAKDGKCGEGKCGAEMKGHEMKDKNKTDAKAKDGKCGEGKCGAEMKDKDMKKVDAKAKDGKCGEGKCGH